MSRLTDPIGYTVELVHGRKPAAAIPVEPSRSISVGTDLRRKTLQRFDARPSTVKKIAHVVLTTPDVPPRGAMVSRHARIGAVGRHLLRCGSQHYRFIQSFAIAATLTSTITSFSAAMERRTVSIMCRSRCKDFDDLMLGHDLLHSKKYRHMWGVGVTARRAGVRLLVRSLGPCARHWTDSDRK